MLTLRVPVYVCLFDCERHSNSSKTQIRQRRRSRSEAGDDGGGVERAEEEEEEKS